MSNPKKRQKAQPKKVSDQREQFERLSITETDLTYGARFLKEYLDRALYKIQGPPHSILADAFTLAVVVTYARPFTTLKNRRGRQESFDSSFLTDPLTRQQRGLHDRLVRERHTIFAHSDARPKTIGVHDTPDGRITIAYDFCALEKREAEDLLAIVQQMQAALKPRLAQLSAAITPDPAP